jgi:ribosomal protein S12 methylthiotransferase accessory factor
MSIRVTFPGGKRVDADLGTHVVRTDQSAAAGGDGSAPEPFALFLASLAACAGIYVLGFCQSRGISSDGLGLVQRHRFDPLTRRLERVELEITLPPGFPEKYRAAVVQAASNCAVKRVLTAPPEIVVTTA